MRLHLLGLALMLAVIPTAADAQAQQSPGGDMRPGESLLMVSAEGVAEAMPDTMTITMGVNSTGATSAEALDAGSTAMEQVLRAVEATGVGIRSVSTDDFGVNPIFPDDYEDEDDVRILGYSASNRIEIELDDFGGAQTLIPALFDAGATDVSGPRWSIENEAARARIEADALRAAIANARIEADTIAQALGMAVSRVIRVSDDSMGNYRYDGGSRGRIVVTGSRVRAIPIEPQPVAVDREIYIEFALVPAS